MKQPVARIVLVGLVAAALASTGYVYYWEKKLEPVIKGPAAKVVPVYFKPAPITWPLRHLNLGYAQFDVPATLPNPLARAGDSLALKIQGVGFIMPPISESDFKSKELLKNFERLTGVKYDSYFELKKHAFGTQPPSVWLAFLPGGRRRLAGDLCLLVTKTRSVGSGEVRIAENEQIGLIITEDCRAMDIELLDKKNSFFQVMSFEKVLPGVNFDEVISSIFYTYRVTVTDFSEDSLRSALDGVVK